MAGFLSDLDAAILHAETPAQHLHVLASLLIDTSDLEGSPHERFQQRMRERAPLVEALRRRPVAAPFGRTAWVDDLSDIDRHLHHVVVDGGGEAALAEWTGRIASAPMAMDRPLWEAWLIEGLAPDRIGVVAKVHHASIDGVSGIWALAAFFDLEAEPTIEPAVPPDLAPAPSATELARQALAELRTRPSDVVRRTSRLVASAVTMLRETGPDTPFPASAPRLPHNGPLTPRREVAIARVRLDDLKSIRRAFGVTVNDAVVAVVTGALRTRLQADGTLPDRPLVAGVPTSERVGEHGLAGNRFSFMLYALPTSTADPLERILAVQRSSEAVKSVYERSGRELLADAAAAVPGALVAPIMAAVSRLGLASIVPPIANVIVSNVRGPDFPLFVAGGKLESMFPIGPLVEGIGLGVTVVTYRDEVAFGFIACPDLFPDVAGLAASVPAELALLQSLTGD
jgi:WS/DGAT/MGAT family acyltransferase